MASEGTSSRRLCRVGALALVAAVATVLPCPLGAQTAGQVAAAGELLEVTHAERLMNEGTSRMLDAMVRGNPQLEPVQDVLKQFLDERLSWKVVKPLVAQRYAETFTEPELRTVIAFYRTPVGQKYVDKAPGLAAAASLIGQQLVRDHIDELQGRIKARMRQLSTDSTGHDSASGAPPSP